MRKIKITVSKTVQEVQYEPFSCSLELEESVDDKMSKKDLDDLYFEKFDEMESRLNEIIEIRLDN